MNIFYLDHAPREAAQAHCDQHVTKMMVEYAQLMSTAHRLTGSPQAEDVYRATHVNHPCVRWLVSSTDHYTWLYDLWRALACEYAARRKRMHLTYQKLSHVLCHNPALPTAGWTPPPQVVPEEFQGSNTIEAYRSYYSRGRVATFARYEWGRSAPSWFSSNASLTC